MYNSKFKEVKEILNEIRPDIIIIQKFVDITEIQGTPIEISYHKTQEIIKMFTIDNVFTEDISLHCNGLHGMPGPYIKDALKNVGVKNLSNIVKLSGNTEAEALCCYTLSSNKQFFNVSKSVMGNIVDPRGNNSFGFDPIKFLQK